jgi:OsmC-like protein
VAAHRRSGLLWGFDEPLAPIGAGLLEGLGERLPRGREDLDERVPVTSQAPELGRVAEVEPDPERVAVVPPDPLDLRLQLLPGGHGTSILTAWGIVRLGDGDFRPGHGITRSVLDVTGAVPGIDEAAFQEAGEQAKENCPVSRALQGNVELTVTPGWGF